MKPFPKYPVSLSEASNWFVVERDRLKAEIEMHNQHAIDQNIVERFKEELVRLDRLNSSLTTTANEEDSTVFRKVRPLRQGVAALTNYLNLYTTVLPRTRDQVTDLKKLLQEYKAEGLCAAVPPR